MSITIQDLSKRFGDFYALDHVSLEIHNGIFGLLGKNGAGKTTLMRILVTLMEPTDGEIHINDIPVHAKNARRIKGIVGYLPQEVGFYPGMTVYEFLYYMSMLQEVPARTAKERIETLLTQVNLTEERNKLVKNLSGGMRRRLGLAQAMINDPPILIVDEPTAGLDPEERVRLRNMLSYFSKDRTVILSTHIVEDIAACANDICVLDKGHVIFHGGIEEILEPIRGKIHSAEFGSDMERETLGDDIIIISEKYTQSSYIVRFYKETLTDTEHTHVTTEEANIEDAFLYLTKLREKEA